MARRRLNTKFLVILIVVVIAGVAGAIVVREIQVGRNAPEFLKRAKASIEAGDLREGRKNLIIYLRHRSDDDEARTLLANTCLDILKLPQREPEDVAYTLKILPESVRLMPENKTVRERYVALLMSLQRWPEAIRHLDYLISRDSQNTDHQVNKLRCLVNLERYDGEDGAFSYGYGLVGYDKATKEFDPAKGIAVDRREPYTILADLLRRIENEPEQGEFFLNQMVSVLPEDELAYLNRCQFYRDLATSAESKAEVELSEASIEAARQLAEEYMASAWQDIEKALELNPTNANVLMTAGQMAYADENYERAIKLFDEGIKNHPEQQQFYLFSAIVENARGNFEAAMAKYDEGIAAVSLPIDLLIRKALTQGENGDIQGMRQTQETLLTSYVLPQEYKDFLEANCLFGEKKWASAARIFEDLSSKMKGRSELFRSIDFNLGRCYEFLGKSELALGAFESALIANPGNKTIRNLAKRMRAKLGRVGGSEGPTLMTLTEAQLAKPEAERDWSEVNQFIEQEIDKHELDSAHAKLLRAEALILRKKYQEAENLIREANNEAPDNPAIWNAAFRLTIRDPNGGPERALKILNNIVKKFGDSPSLREWKARTYLLIGGDELEANLDQLTAGIEDWPTYDQVLVYKFLGKLYLQVGKTERAEKCMQQAAVLSPEDRESRVALFELAIARQDEEAIEAAQKSILELVKDENDSTYLFTQAARILMMNQNAKPDSPEIESARRIIEKALVDRPEWDVLHRLKGQIAQIQGRQNDAIEAYSRAENLGQPNPSAVRKHAALLYAQGRMDEAALVANQLNKDLRIKLLQRLNAEIMFHTGNIEEAIETYETLIETEPNNATLHLGYGQLLLRIDQQNNTEKHRAKAEEMLHKAVQLEPQSPQVWLAWIAHLNNSKRPEDAEQALREAQLALPADSLPIVVAKCNEILGRWYDAECYYRTAYENNPNNLRLARFLADFYLGRGYRRADRVEKATPYINQILHAAADGDIANDHADVLWARRKAADIYSQNKSYPDLLKAEQLLEANATDVGLRPEDKLQLAQILESRPEPASRLKAIELLEEVGKNARLSLAAELSLGKLYNKVGRWAKAREQMLAVIGRFGDQSIVWETYVQMLIDHKDFNEAKSMLERLIKLQPKNTKNLQVIQLLVQVFVGEGEEDKAVAWLRSQLPKDLDSAGPEYLDTIAAYVNLFNMAGDTGTAEMLCKKHLEIATKTQDASKINQSSLMLVSQQARYGNIDDAVNNLKAMWDQSKSPQVLSIALSLLSLRRDLADSSKDELIELIESWFNRALQEDPESIPLLNLLARLREIQNNYKEAESIYRRLLDKPELESRTRGIVMNNLAFLLALQQKDLAEAGQYVEEGIGLFGPTAEMLDTRAVVRMAQKDARRAIEDLELALQDNPTAAKYFHLAQAYLLVGDKRQASNSWEKAEEMDLGPQSLNDLEHDTYEKVRKKIAQLRIQESGN